MIARFLRLYNEAFLDFRKGLQDPKTSKEYSYLFMRFFRQEQTMVAQTKFKQGMSNYNPIPEDPKYYIENSNQALATVLNKPNKKIEKGRQQGGCP